MIGWMKGGLAPVRAALGTAIALSLALPMFCISGAQAAQDAKPTTTKSAPAKTAPEKATTSKLLVSKTAAVQPSSKTAQLKGSKSVVAQRNVSYGISCVPYARAVTGMGIKGNAKDWWNNASGIYARGHVPESGAVMSFQGTRSMSLGHVAVVTRVLDNRTVEIDHANWRGPGASKGGVFKNIPVVDVSANNDWSKVRVGLGHSGDYGGTVYPTNGFIYDRPDNGSMLAAATVRSTTTVAEATPARWRDADAIVRQVR